jgi:HlyD family secretion protein
MQSVTIRTGDSNLSPEEIEQKKKIADAKEKADNNAQVENERLAKQAVKEERETLKKVVFLKDGGKAKMVRVTTGIADDANIEIKNGVKPGDEVISGSYSAISRKLKEGAKVVMEKPEKK